MERTSSPNTASWPQRRIAKAKRRVRELMDGEQPATRRRLSDRYLHGDGVEIGALHMPLRVPRTARVRYVDRMTVPSLREHYPELRLLDLVTPDIIDDGERLGTLPDESADFVIANHFIEHCQDPIGTLMSHVRVLRVGGTLYMAVPDKRLTFDKDREITPLAHVLRDHEEGPAWSHRTHYEEWAKHIDGVDDAQVAARADELIADDYSIHFHVWTPDAFLELLVHARAQLGLPVELEAIERNGHEFIVILRKAAPTLRSVSQHAAA
jgi:SAM-dependent methyltransferase